MQRYVGRLRITYQVSRLPPLAGNPEKRVLKTPKVYGRDTGLMAAMTDALTGDDLMREGRTRALFDTWVHGEPTRLLTRSTATTDGRPPGRRGGRPERPRPRRVAHWLFTYALGHMTALGPDPEQGRRCTDGHPPSPGFFRDLFRPTSHTRYGYVQEYCSVWRMSGEYPK